NRHAPLARCFASRRDDGGLLACFLSAVQWRGLGLQRHVSAHMAGSDALLHRGAAVPRQDRPWRPVLDRNPVWRRLAHTTYAIAVAAGVLDEIFQNPVPQCLGAADEVARPFRF